MKNILLIGTGRFGSHIAKKLNEMNNQVLAIDKDEEKINEVLPFVTSAQIGDSTNEEFLDTLGIRNFDACIVAIGDSFQNSLETVYLLKEKGAKYVIARACRDVQQKFLLRNGADEVVYPEKQLGTWTAIRCTSKNILDYIEVDDCHIFEILVPEKWYGKTVQELDVRRRYNLNILGIRKEGGKMHMNVGPDTVLQPGSSILVLGSDLDIRICFNV